MKTVLQRLGFLPSAYQQTSCGTLWFHAVSLGEIIAIVPLIHRTQELLPRTPVFVSTTTLAGFSCAQEKLAHKVSGIFFFPLDYVWAVRRILRRLRPSVVIVTETEIWPNLFREVWRADAKLIVVNARISDRAFPKYTRWKWVFSAVLSHISEVAAQSSTMRDRFLNIGASSNRVSVSGNLKYDLQPTASLDPQFARFFAGHKVWVAASTSADANLAEEEVVLDAFRKLTGWKLLLAPRKPERFRQVASFLDRSGLSWISRTELHTGSEAQILLLDTVGELSGLFSLADAVFVGGSLANCGGHNILEPAWFAKAITVGPHLENFREMADEFRAARAFHQIQTPAELQPYLDSEMGVRAQQTAIANRGATEQTAQKIFELYQATYPSPKKALPTRIFLWPLALLWRWGGSLRRAKALSGQSALPAPVISVGNITVGGTGKTPVVLHLARHFAAQGLQPAVLTRGYGRTSRHDSLILAPGEHASKSTTGDEAQIILRSGVAALGIGSQRIITGRELVRRKLANIFILDDGFQHVHLARNFDLVLIDALDPWGGSELVPLGRLREPLEQLRRASAFLITRADRKLNTVPLESKLHSLHPSAPIFRSRVLPKEWVELGTNQSFPIHALPVCRSIAFCGLGNPQSFWTTLQNLHLKPIDKLEFSDHHLYTPREIRRLGQLGREANSEAFLTTEKDLINLCEHAGEAIQPLRLFALKIDVEIDGEERLLDLIRNSYAS